MNSSISAMHEFKKVIDYTTEGPEIALFVYAEMMGKVVYQSKAMCAINYDIGYEQYRIDIEWEDMDNEEVARRGLHFSYNTNFQEMKFKGGALIIVTDSGTITLSKV